MREQAIAMAAQLQPGIESSKVAQQAHSKRSVFPSKEAA
jgi:hypothetical protein